jgi:hypothetical protein
MEVYMSEMMVRKQIYLPRRQNLLLKRLAKERGVSEAEVIRQALEREVQSTAPVVRESKKALEEIFAIAEALSTRPELAQGKPVRWNREELYDERESRWIHSAREE